MGGLLVGRFEVGGGPHLGRVRAQCMDCMIRRLQYPFMGTVYGYGTAWRCSVLYHICVHIAVLHGTVPVYKTVDVFVSGKLFFKFSLFLHKLVLGFCIYASVIYTPEKLALDTRVENTATHAHHLTRQKLVSI